MGQPKNFSPPGGFSFSLPSGILRRKKPPAEPAREDTMRETLETGLPALGLTLSEGQIDTLCAFGQALLEKNQVMNLSVSLLMVTTTFIE